MSIRARSVAVLFVFVVLLGAVSTTGSAGATASAATAPPLVVIFRAEGGAPAEVAVSRCRAALAARGAEIAAAILGGKAPADSVPGAAADSGSVTALRPIICYVVDTATLRERLARLPDWGIGAALPGGRAILIDWKRATVGRRGIEEIFLHELTHAVLDQGLRGAEAPAWFQEGLAQRRSGEWKLVDTVALVLDGAPPRLDRLSGAFPASADWADQAYRVSLLAVQALEKQYGDDVVPRLVAASAREGSFDFGFEDVTGIGVDQFAARFDASLQHRFGWLVTLTRWPGLFVILAIVVLIAGARGLTRTRRRLADLDDDLGGGGAG